MGGESVSSIPKSFTRRAAPGSAQARVTQKGQQRCLPRRKQHRTQLAWRPRCETTTTTRIATTIDGGGGGCLHEKMKILLLRWHRRLVGCVCGAPRWLPRRPPSLQQTHRTGIAPPPPRALLCKPSRARAHTKVSRQQHFEKLVPSGPSNLTRLWEP